MAQIIYDINNAVLPRVRDALLYIYPNIETIDDPTWTPVPDEDPPQIPKYTDNQWLKELIRRWVIQQIKRSEQKQAQDAVAVPADDTLVT